MKKLLKFIPSIVVGMVLAAGGVSVTSPVQAAEEEAKPQKTRRVPSMSESVYKKLTEAQEAIDIKDYDLAVEVLEKMLARSKRFNGNEVGQVHSMLGYIYFLKEDFVKAIGEYKLVVAQGEEIPEGLEQTTLYTLAQLLLKVFCRQV